MGGERRGRDESKHHQRDRVTFLRAQGSLIRGGSHQRRRGRHRIERMVQKKKRKANETFYFARKRAITLQPRLAAKQGVFNRDAQSEQNNFKMKGRRGLLCNT